MYKSFDRCLVGLTIQGEDGYSDFYQFFYHVQLQIQ